MSFLTGLGLAVAASKDVGNGTSSTSKGSFCCSGNSHRVLEAIGMLAKNVAAAVLIVET